MITSRVPRKGFWRDESGSGMAEFALVGALFSAMILAFMEFGIATWQRNCAVSDAREGARYAIVHGALSPRIATVDSIRKYVLTRTALDTAGLRVYAVWPDGKDPGQIVQVSVAHTVPRRGPFLPTHVDSATTKMVILF